MPTPQELERKFWKALADDKTMMLGLHAADEGHTRPMTAQMDGERGPIWFFASRDNALVGGATAYTSDGVTGILNVFNSGMAAGHLWTGVVRAVASLRPGLPIVGYERGEDLAAARRAGFTVLGSLRIWARRSAVA